MQSHTVFYRIATSELQFTFTAMAADRADAIHLFWLYMPDVAQRALIGNVMRD